MILMEKVPRRARQGEVIHRERYLVGRQAYPLVPRRASGAGRGPARSAPSSGTSQGVIPASVTLDGPVPSVGPRARHPSRLPTAGIRPSVRGPQDSPPVAVPRRATRMLEAEWTF